MHARTIAVGVLGLCLVASAATGQTPAIDPLSLLGEWVGTIKGPANFDYYLTLTKADGNKISGKARNVGQRTSEYPITGTVEGNVFKYKSTVHPLSVELVIDGDTMKGFGERPDVGAVGQFSLKKKK
jgi:transcriptional antiterminator Rof (Rho-off)